MTTYFISAIDTDAGKTIATGLLGKHLKEQGRKVMTMKLAQTGCLDVSEDIEVHRQIMQMPLSEDDRQGKTCPYVFKYAASPHLSAAMENSQIEAQVLIEAIRNCAQKHETVLVEGVGGLMVPLHEDFLVVDFVQQQELPVILVVSGKLGSINHSLLSLEIMKNRGVNLFGVIYNHHPMTSELITQDSAKTIRRFARQYFPKAHWAEMPFAGKNAEIDLTTELEDWKL